jgi:hypothetical protein
MKLKNLFKIYMIIPYKIKQVDQAIEKVTRRFKCPHCENDYASPSGRRRHVKSEHSESENPDISQETGDTIKLREHP